MTGSELKEHLEFMDGIQKAQMVVLRALLRDQPALKITLQRYAEQMESNPPADNLSPIQLEAIKSHLLGLSQ